MIAPMMVSDVGRTASGSSSSSMRAPAFVTQATSGAKPSTCSASFIRNSRGISSGKAQFSCPLSLIMSSKARWIASHIAQPYGRTTIIPRTPDQSASSALRTTSVYQRSKSADILVTSLTKSCCSSGSSFISSLPRPSNQISRMRPVVVVTRQTRYARRMPRLRSSSRSPPSRPVTRPGDDRRLLLRREPAAKSLLEVPEVFEHELARGIRVVRADRVKDLLVRLLGHLRRTHVAHVVERLHEQVAVRRDGRGEELVVRGIGHGDVEIHARLGVRRLFANDRAALLDGLLDALDGRRVGALRRELARRRLYHRARLGEARERHPAQKDHRRDRFGYLVGVRLGHERAAARTDLHVNKPASFEHPQRVAHRDPRHTEALGELALG